MRIIYLLFLGLSISLITALDYTRAPKVSTTTSQPTTTKVTKSLNSNDKTKSTSRNAKSLRLVSENRDKRTIFDFGNAGYLYSNVANRRAGYTNGATQNYHPQEGYYNGQNAVAHYPRNYAGNYAPYPQYLEAPEPIIEIIIKDSNDTLPNEPQQPIITKKKKEKVHVFYVNYKKDHNNKLHLESPIASINNDDTTEEVEEIVHLPQPVTPLPPLRTTTLRTIIHPDSEKYHSNSGIHVTFGTEDKAQTGHILEENNAESIQRQVVALPAGVSPNVLSGFKAEDFETSAQSRNQISETPFQHAQYSQSEQQLPEQHASHFFRPQAELSNTNNNNNNKQQTRSLSASAQFYQKLPLQQQSSIKFSSQQSPLLPQPQAQYRKVPTTQQQVQQKQQQQQQQPSAQYYSNYNQHFQQQSNLYQPLTHKPTQAPKSTFVFPTVPQKIQELPVRQSPAPYQPIKFRPTSAPLPQIKPVQLPVKLENTNFQTPQYKIQTLYQKSQQQYQQKNPSLPTNPYFFNRQPQFVKQPSFTLPVPTIPSFYKTRQTPTQISNQYQNQKLPQTSQTSSSSAATAINNYLSQHYNQQQNSFKTSNFNQQQSSISATLPSAAGNQQHSSSSFGSLNKFIDMQPSRETELLKAVPKFEQHITETIHHPITPKSQPQQLGVYTNYAYSNGNQVIHDMPAPNLGPTSQTFNQQNHTPFIGHYITAANLNTQNAQQQTYNNFFTTSQPTSTAAPTYAESTDGQKIMIVTPMPPIIYDQYHSSQYSDNQGNNQHLQEEQQQREQQQQKHQTQQQQQYAATVNYAQQPRQSQTNIQATSTSQSSQTNSQFGVSTHHADVFKELEQREQQQKQEFEEQKTPYENEQADNQSQTQQDQQQAQQYQTDSAQNHAQLSYVPTNPSTSNSPQSADSVSNSKQSQTLLQIPDEVPDDLRQQLLSSGILNNADISVLDYDKIGAVNLENLPAEHLQNFYSNGGGAQISESNQILTVVRPNGEQVSLSEKEIERVKTSNSVPKKHNLDVKVVRFNANNQKSLTDKYVKTEATIVPPVDLAYKLYNRYLPLKINGAQFPIPDSEELKGTKIVSVVVLAPVEADANGEARSTNSDEAKEIKFINGDLIKTLVKKPTKENFKRWLEKEAKTQIEQQSVVLLVAKSSDIAEQEIFMYDIATGIVNKLNGELSSKFVNVAEENASSEDLEHASTLDPSALEQMMQPSTSHS